MIDDYSRLVCELTGSGQLANTRIEVRLPQDDVEPEQRLKAPGGLMAGSI